MESVDLNNANLTIKLDYSLKFRYARGMKRDVRSNWTINSTAATTTTTLNFIVLKTESLSQQVKSAIINELVAKLCWWARAAGYYYCHVALIPPRITSRIGEWRKILNLHLVMVAWNEISQFCNNAHISNASMYSKMWQYIAHSGSESLFNDSWKETWNLFYRITILKDAFVIRCMWSYLLALKTIRKTHECSLWTEFLE